MSTGSVTTRIVGSLAVGALLLASGCGAVGIVGVIGENYKRTHTHTIEAQYRGLEDKSFAVVVVSGRGIESEVPGIGDAMMDRICARLSLPEVGAAGKVPAVSVIKALYDHPSWQSMTYAEMAKNLLGGVDRLVYIELEDVQLYEPGNRYEWNGLASGRLMVFESDGLDPNQVTFEKAISVKFPDKQGFTPDDIDALTVKSTLLARFVDRASWLFYDHQEPYYPDY